MTKAQKASGLTAVVLFFGTFAMSQTTGLFKINQRIAPVRVAAPITNVIAFETEFTRRLNEAIRFSSRQTKETTAVNTKIYRDFIDKTAWKTTDLKAAALSNQELIAFRELTSRRFDLAVTDELAQRGGLNKLGNGVITSNFFTGKLQPAPGVSLAPLQVRETIDSSVASAR